MSGAPETLQVNVARQPDSIRLTLRGDLDLESTPILAAAIDELRPLSAPLILDMTEVAFMDSSGLRALLGIREQTLTDTGAGPTLTGCAPTVLRVLEVTKTEGLLHVDR